MPIDKKFDKVRYKHAAYAAAQMDAYVMVVPLFATDSIPQEPGENPGTSYYIGVNQDREAGIFDGYYSPFFDSLAELDAFCFGARNEYDLLAEMSELPEKFFWEEPIVNS